MKKKNGFWTFVFSMIPGAGQMYQGYMKRGLSLMTMFCGICGLGVLFRSEWVWLLLPVVWFYAFFDGLNIRGYTPEEIMAHPDTLLLLGNGEMRVLWERLYGMRGKGMGVVLIVVGGYLLLQNTFSWLMGWLGHLAPVLYDFLYGLLNRLPVLAVAVVIILFGIHLVRGGKKEQKLLEDITTYKG